jgi:signal transduction histidine kinase
MFLAIPSVFAIVCFPFLPVWAWALSGIERRRVRIVGVPSVRGRADGLGLFTWGNIAARLREPLTWREVANTLVHLVFAMVSYLTMILGGTLVVTLLAAPVLVLAGTPFIVGGWRADDPFSSGALAIFGLFGLAVFGYLLALVAGVQARVTSALLSSAPEALQQQVELLTDARLDLVDAFEAERRRIERDLHDGPQQHLAGAAIYLGLLRTQLADREHPGLKYLDAAHNEIDRSLDALRAAVAGLRPRALVEQGLAAALNGLSAQAVIPLAVTTSLHHRLPQPIEASLYSIATEFIANTLKHSGAKHTAVSLQEDEGGLIYKLSDDGRGGASPATGTGILGIQHRVRLLGGVARLISPIGGPTTLTITIPRSSAVSERET